MNKLVKESLIINEYSIWDKEKEELEELTSVKQLIQFDGDYEYLVNKKLFDWLLNLLTKYGYENDGEIVTLIFNKARNNQEGKKWVYRKLKKYGLDNIEFLKKLYERFNELVSQSGRL